MNFLLLASLCLGYLKLVSNIEQVLNLNFHQKFSEKLGPNWLVPKFCKKNMSEINMTEMRPNRIELKPLTNKYGDNDNHHHMLIIDTVQKSDIIDVAEFDSWTALYYLVNLVARGK